MQVKNAPGAAQICSLQGRGLVRLLVLLYSLHRKRGHVFTQS
jgi:hypothetical protein